MIENIVSYIYSITGLIFFYCMANELQPYKVFFKRAEFWKDAILRALFFNPCCVFLLP